MIHAFGVENFKSLHVEEVELLPLTILAGINNTGKTTFIQSILELTRYHEEKSLALSSMPVLSNYTTKVLDHNIENEIKFHMKVKLSSQP